MENIIRCVPVTYPEGYIVFFEFPAKSELDNQIQREVKAILEGMMREHLQRTS